MSRKHRLGFSVLVASIVAAACLAGCQTREAASRSTGYPRAPETYLPSDFDGELFIVGVLHAPGQLVSAACSTGHYRAVLEALSPEVVCVECDPQWLSAGRSYRATYEAQGVTIPWARARGLPVYGIDWVGETFDDPDRSYSTRMRLEQVQAERAALDRVTASRMRYSYGIATEEDATCETIVSSFLTINSEESQQETLSWIDGEKGQPGSAAEYMDVRDGWITHRILEVVARHPHQRIVVFIGAQHKGDLDRRLRERGVPPADFRSSMGGIVLSDTAEIESRLAASDITAALSQAWDTGAQSTTAYARAIALLGRLRDLAQTEEERAWLAYFEARRLQLQGDIERSRAAFATLADSSFGFPFHGEGWRQFLTIGQAACLELGRIADEIDERGEAVRWYERALDSIRVPEYDPGYFSDYLYFATAVNAIRALVAEGYDAGAVETPEPPEDGAGSTTTPAAISGMDNAIASILELNRSGAWKEALGRSLAILDRSDAPTEIRYQAYAMAAYASARLGDRASARGYLNSAYSEGARGSSTWAAQELERVRQMLD